jgi:HAD superfamily hydrolase (TIGR01484 family)
MKYSKPRIIFSDFDGTLSDHKEFSTKFIDIINLCDQQKVPFVIVTGRSISWAHFFLTHFEKIEYVISEGGGSLSYRDGNGFLIDEYLVADHEIEWLEKFSKELVKQFPMVRLSADSTGRVSDRAIELFDLKDPELLESVKKFMKAQNINFSTSNVHLNFWCGDVSKYEASKYFLSRFYDHISIEESMFFGDSLNDQSMFQNIQHSVGVSNISEVASELEHEPSVILIGDKNKGPHGVLNYLRESVFKL